MWVHEARPRAPPLLRGPRAECGGRPGAGAALGPGVQLLVRLAAVLVPLQGAHSRWKEAAGIVQSA